MRWYEVLGGVALYALAAGALFWRAWQRDRWRSEARREARRLGIRSRRKG